MAAKPHNQADRAVTAGEKIAKVFRDADRALILLIPGLIGASARTQLRKIRALESLQMQRAYRDAVAKVLRQTQKEALAIAQIELAEAYTRAAEEATAFAQMVERMALEAEAENLSEEAEDLHVYVDEELASYDWQIEAQMRTIWDELSNQWLASLRHMHRDADDVYRQVIEAVSSAPNADGGTLRSAVQDVLNRFADNGVTGFTDRAGRNWGIAEYSEMAMRTAIQRASLMGTARGMLNNGQDLCYINRHMGACPLCTPWEGRILSLTGRTPGYPTLQQAMDAKLFHPNCAHILQVYIEGVSDLNAGAAEDYTTAESHALHAKRQRQRYMERMVRKYKRRQAAALSPEAERAAQAHVQIWQRRLRELIGGDVNMPRRYDREGARVILSERARALPRYYIDPNGRARPLPSPGNGEKSPTT